MKTKEFMFKVQSYYGLKYRDGEHIELVYKYLDSKHENYLTCLYSATVKNFSGQYKTLPDIAIFEGLKDKTNKYFLILSGECIPLFTFWETYKKVTASKKSRMNINKDTGLYSETNLYYSDQWVVLNRKCAEILTELVDTRRGQKFEDNIRDRLELHCPDETYPINWFVNVLGHPRSKKFKEQIQNKVTTYTYWGENSLHPLRFNYRQVVKMKKDICESGALFARKFNSKAARNFSMTCGQK